MTEKENIIKALGEIAAYFRSSFESMAGGTLACETFRWYAEAAGCALALLKAQEPVEPILDIDEWKCGSCGHALEYQELLGDNVLFHEQYNYCPECGRMVKLDDLISRKAAIDAVYYKSNYKMAIEVLKEVPAVDAVPVVHGRWLDEKPNTYTQEVKCSVCNGSAPFVCKSADYYGMNMHGDFAKTKYCPNCGAKMDGERRENE